MLPDTSRNHAAPSRAPAQDQSGYVALLQSGQIDRQHQKGRGVTSPRDAAAHGTRQTVGAARIGGKDYFKPSRLDPVARGLARDHDNDLRGCEACHQGEGSTQ